MPNSILDPSLSADHAPSVAGELRGQFEAIANTFGHVYTRLGNVTPLGLAVSNPPTQVQAQAIADKLDELIQALNP